MCAESTQGRERHFFPFSIGFMIKLSCVILVIGLGVGCSGELSAQTTINLAQPPRSLNTSPMPAKVVEAYPRLRLSRPIVLTGAGDGSGRLFIAGQRGKIFFIDASDHDVERADLYIDLSKRVAYKDRENE
jgi:hypothetical protein